ncbi:MAG: dihydrofolate reductase [Osedax symbiont Rs1]|nr:MAG: dihydrofolate reductase [Osedax symbiont Rs1]
MKLAIIVAQSTNRVIGINNTLPWKLPKDLQYFKQVTTGKPIIMGRKTYQSIGRPLPNRSNIVITRDASYSPAGVQVVNSLDAAIEFAKAVCDKDGGSEVMVIGGAQIYQQALPMADTLYITEVNAVIEGDAFFPDIDYRLYAEQSRQDCVADQTNPYSYSFVTYKKVV